MTFFSTAFNFLPLFCKGRTRRTNELLFPVYIAILNMFVFQQRQRLFWENIIFSLCFCHICMLAIGLIISFHKSHSTKDILVLVSVT